MKENTRVCVLSYNSVLSDARILRESNSLAEAGYAVDIIGFADKRHNPGWLTLPNGVRLTLLNPVPVLTGWVNKSAIILSALMAAAGLFLLFGPQVWPLCIVFGFLAFLIIKRRHVYSLLKVVGWYEKILPVFGYLGKLKNKLSESVNRGYRLLRRYMGRNLKWKILRKAAEELNPDIVHCHDLMTLPAGVEAVRSRKAILVWDAHEIYEEMAQADMRQREMNRRLLKNAQKSVNAFITINDSIAAFYRENYPALPSAVVIKNATVRAHSLNPDRRLFKTAGLPIEQKIVLYQGGFAEKRGLRALVAAARFLKPEWTLVMMGWGNIEKELREIGNEVLAVTQDRKVPAIRFLPGVPQAELVMWTAGARVGVIPYERCGLNHLYCTPNKLWEYPNAGVPILCSPLVEMSKVVEQYKIGWLLPDDASPESIADVINRLQDSEIERARLACVDYMEQENWSVYEERLLHLYSTLSDRLWKGGKRSKVLSSLKHVSWTGSGRDSAPLP